MEIKISKLPKSEIEIEGEIPFSDLEKHKEKALEKLSADLDAKGFRKGHIPEKIALEKIGQDRILNEMAEMALGNAYPKIIIDNKIDPIAHPQITITKIAMNNPLGFKIKVPVMPEIKLPEFKKIAKDISSKKEEIEVKKEDVEIVINQVLESKKDLSAQAGKDGNKPKLTDELVKTLGDFKDLDDFNKKVEEGVRKEKEFRAAERKRLQIMEEIIAKSEIELPEIIVNSELDKMIEGFKNQITQMGLKVDEYMKNNNKTFDDLRKEWRSEAEKKGKSQLILNKIAVEEKIYPKKEDIEKEVEHLMTHHKDADKNRVRVYVETILTNQRVMEFLENGGEHENKKEIENKDKKE